jgi:hypothetical protein
MKVKRVGEQAGRSNVADTVPFSLLAWIDAASNALPDAQASAAPVTTVQGGDPNSFVAHITLTLVLIVVGGIAIILTQSYLGRRRHPPEWVNELDAEQQLREKERNERLMIRGRAPGDDIDGETTRALLERVSQLRGMGSVATAVEPVSLAEAIANARRAPEKYEDAPESPATTGSIAPETLGERADSPA